MNVCWFPLAAGRAGRDGDGLSRRRWLGLSLAAFAAPLLLAAGCEQAAPPPPRKPPEVVVTTPVRGEVVDYQDFTGRLDGFRTVDVRARVSGYITEAPFKEGDPVHEGDLLFQIDRRPYEAALNQTEAQVHLQEAQLKYQEALYRRNIRLQQQGHSVALEDLQQSQAQRDTTAAQLEASRAALEMAKLNLSWTKVTAPISGRVSRRSVDPGNLVSADNTIASTGLTTVVSDHQLYAYFDVDERTYLNLVGPVAPGQSTSWMAGLQFPVLMSLANEGDKYDHVGKVDFIDNRVTATTGTIRMRGVFDNSTGALKSGLFVRVRLPLGKPYPTLFISGEALQSDQGRTYVYVVNHKEDKDEVEYRLVTVGQVLQGLQVIKEGLKGDERVVLSGQQRVRNGAQVEVKVQPPPKRPESPLVPLLSALPAGRTANKGGKGTP